MVHVPLGGIGVEIRAIMELDAVPKIEGNRGQITGDLKRFRQARHHIATSVNVEERFDNVLRGQEIIAEKFPGQATCSGRACPEMLLCYCASLYVQKLC